MHPKCGEILEVCIIGLFNLLNMSEGQVQHEFAHDKLPIFGW